MAKTSKKGVGQTITINGESFKVIDRAGSKRGDILWLTPEEDPEETRWVYAKEVNL